ncbi:MAG: hypothetical protein ABI668_10410 [Sphingorhabdus sp.]
MKLQGCSGVAGVILLTVGSAQSWLALNLETCTQDAADSLIFGYVSLFLYVLGATALWLSPLPRLVYLWLVPAALLAVSHTVFAVQFAVGYFTSGLSACSAMHGADMPYGLDGRERHFIMLWLTLSIIFWIGLASIFQKRGPGA